MDEDTSPRYLVAANPIKRPAGKRGGMEEEENMSALCAIPHHVYILSGCWRALDEYVSLPVGPLLHQPSVVQYINCVTLK